MRKILVALSGGVDSAAACGFLRDAGFELGGATMLLREGGEAEATDARRAAEQLGIPFHLFSLKEEFQKNVISPFIESYASGKTPNPCIFCNESMKFGLFLEKALALGYDGIATGHYARIVRDKERYLLKTALDTTRDQSYVLYRLRQDQLCRTLFPLGDKSKQDARRMAESLGLSLAHKHDSQDICFVPDGDYMAYASRHGLAPQPGFFRDTDGHILGRHSGQAGFTIGQRRGLGLGGGQRVYVLGKSGNDVIVGDGAALYSSELRLTQCNLISIDRPAAPLRVEAKIRYAAKPAPATLLPEQDGFLLRFDTPQRAVTPGQSAVFYQGDTVLGGGYIV